MGHDVRSRSFSRRGIDTGYLPHPDLVGRLFGGYDFIDDAVIANDIDPI
jgi:hypothetical protein